MKTIEFGGLNGVRNDISLERYKLNDLSVGSNVDIDETGKVLRRHGTTSVLTGVMHSLYSRDGVTLVVDGGNLTLIDAEFGKHVLTSVVGSKLSYAKINDAIHWSDQYVSGIVADGANRRWGVAIPPRPDVTTGIGDFAAGRYQVTVTYVRYDGHESGAPYSTEINLPANSGFTLALTPSTNPQVELQRIYLSDINGEACFLAAEVLNSATSLTLSGMPSLGPVVRTQFFGPLPPGQVVGYFAGRAYVASGAYLWYSLPYEYELCDLRSGYVAFDTTVTVFAPVSDGVFVGSNRSVQWLAGTDPTQFERKQVANYGAVRGTVWEIAPFYLGREDFPQGVVQTFMTARGVCAGMDHGVFKNLTGERYFPVAAKEGASLLKVRSGTPLLTTTLFN